MHGADSSSSRSSDQRAVQFTRGRAVSSRPFSRHTGVLTRHRGLMAIEI